MADFPALPLWTDAYLSDTRHLSTEEHGAYLLLLMEAWRRPNCDLPDDDVFMARAAGLSPDRWAAIRPVVLAFWKRDGRRRTWSQKRLQRERDYVATKRQLQRDKAAKRWKGEKSADAPAEPRQSRGNAPTPTPTPTTSVETSVSTGGEPPPPDPVKAMFDAGVRLLGQAGTEERQARSILGRWSKAHGPEAVIVALGRAQREGAVDPVSFVEGVFRWQAKQGPKGAPQEGEERTLPSGQLQRYSAFDGWMNVYG